LVEPDGGGDRDEVAGPGAIDVPAVPVGVAGVDQRLPGRAIAEELVEAHERVAQREVGGVRRRRGLQTAAGVRVTSQRLLGSRAEDRLRGRVRRLAQAEAAEAERVLVTTLAQGGLRARQL